MCHKHVVSTFRFLSLLMFSLVATGTFVGLFSAIGNGDKVFRWLNDRDEWSTPAGASSAAILLMLHLFDFGYWSGCWRWLRNLLIVIAVLLMVAGAVLAAESYPALPMATFMIGVPLYFWAIQKLFFNQRCSRSGPVMPAADQEVNVNVEDGGEEVERLPTAAEREFDHSMAIYLESLGAAMAITFSLTLAMWVLWMSGGLDENGEDKWWTEELRVEYAERMRCPVPTVERPTCLAAYLLWISPFIASLVSLVFGVVCYALGSQMMQRSSRSLHSALRVFLILVLLSVLGMWAAASVAGAGMQLSNVVTTFAAAAIVVVTAVVLGTLGWDGVMQQIMRIPLVKRIHSSFLSDWAKALFVAGFGLLFLGYLALAAINQMFRRCFHCAKTMDGDESSLRLTLVASKQLQAARNWDWASVLVKVIYVGLFFIVINVGVGKAVTLFMSWLVEALDGVSVLLSIAIFVGVGLSMFLLPPVPGVPVYLAGGVILVSSLRDDLGFWGAGLAATGICFMIKLMAIIVQQKGFGQGLSGRVSIRCMVGVNSITIRAIQRILETPGMDRRKVSILIGGPDWPTSVLTGILRLSLAEMLLGSLPVVVLIAPCVFGGAFLLRAEDGVWASVASVTLALAAVAQMTALMAAMYFIEQEAHENGALLAAIPNDPEVEAVELDKAEKQRQYKEVANWHSPDFPITMKILLWLGAILMMGCMYIVALFPEDCFLPYDVTDSIDVKLEGDVLNIVLFLGYVAMGLMAGAIVCVFIFTRWAKCRVRSAKRISRRLDRQVTELSSSI